MTANFIASGIAGLALSKLPQQHGNKRVMGYILLANSLAQICCLLFPSLSIRLACFAVFGITQTKMSFAFGWIDGFIPEKDRSIVNGIIICYDNLTVALTILYVLFVNRNIQALLYLLVAVGVLANFLTFWLLPESPKWFDS
jgi:MFS family permease